MEAQQCAAVRLNRYLALAGVCSRRRAEALIKAGRVAVAGRAVRELATRVRLEGEEVKVDGRPVCSAEKRQVLLLNKPAGVVSTTNDPQERVTVLDLLWKNHQRQSSKTKQQARLYPVGRLDKDTTGVLLLTNDGGLCYRLTHPSQGVKKRYRVRLRSRLEKHDLRQLRQGVRLADGLMKADWVQWSEGQRELLLEVHSGKKRVIRRMMEALGGEVTELERLAFAGLTAGRLRRGEWRRLGEKEINRLAKQGFEPWTRGL